MTAATVVPAARIRTDLVTSLLGVWFTVGLMLDAWAHNNVPGLETFFTPWHAAFYTGFVAVGLWIAWTARAGIRDGRWNPAVMPRAYPAATLALGGFAVAAFGDFVWHKVFGIEQSINILFSPTHLGLVAAMMVIVTTPLRSFWSDPALLDAPGLRRTLPAVLSVSLAATLVLLFFQYANVLVFGPDELVFSLSGSGHDTGDFFASLGVTSLVLIVPLLLLAGRCQLPVGASTVLYAVVAGLGGAITGFEHPVLTGSLVVAGVAVDGLSAALHPGPANVARYRLFAFFTPLLTWAVYFGSARALSSAQFGYEDRRPESGLELWTGAPIVQGLVGLLVASLLVMAARSQPRSADE